MNGVSVLCRTSKQGNYNKCSIQTQFKWFTTGLIHAGLQAGAYSAGKIIVKTN